MAEASIPAENQKEPSSSVSEDKELQENLECAVCLQTCVYPAVLPCGHIFCFLCVKGIANQSKRCAMCRQEIPRDFIEQPILLRCFPSPQPVAAATGPPDEGSGGGNAEGYDGGYQWFYEGRNGWWQYDERTSKELESAYKNGEKTAELLIAGFLYIADLENMVQLRRNDPSRCRYIKRDFATIPKKGIAGLRTDQNSGVLAPAVRRSSSPVEGRLDDNASTAAVPATPSNTPQSPTTGSGRESPAAVVIANQEEDLQATVERINALRLDSDAALLTPDNTNNDASSQLL